MYAPHSTNVYRNISKKLYISIFFLVLKVSIQKQKNCGTEKSPVFENPKK